ncbi:hypothetical protein ACRWYJ_23650, partial [Escherichia coli]
FDVFAGKKSAQIREILISESAWEEMTCLFAPSLRDCKDIKGEEEKKEGCVKHRERSSEVHFLY